MDSQPPAHSPLVFDWNLYTPEAQFSRFWPRIIYKISYALSSVLLPLAVLPGLNLFIFFLRKRIGWQSDSDPFKSDFLSQLGFMLTGRFQLRGALGDLNEAIAVHLRAIELTHVYHPQAPLRISRLSMTLMRRYEQLGDDQDLNEAIKFSRQAVDRASILQDHPDRPMLLSALGLQLLRRFQRHHDMPDLEGAVLMSQSAVELISERITMVTQAACHGNLANCLYARYELNDEIQDLNTVIDHSRRAVSFMHDKSPERPACLGVLGIALLRRYDRQDRRQDDESDLLETISLYRTALRSVSKDDHERPDLLHGLAVALQRSFLRHQKLADLDESIECVRCSAGLVSDDYPKKANYWRHLGYALEIRFEHGHLERVEDLESAIEYYMRSASSTSGLPSLRLDTAQRCAEMCWRHRNFVTNAHLLRAYECAISLMPEVAWLGYDVTRRYSELSRLDDIASAAAAVAIEAEQIDRAVKWLEEGRSVVWGQILQLRTPLDDLAEKDPVVAQRLQRVASDLDRMGTLSPFLTFDRSNDRNVQHRALAREYREILVEIRKIPGFQRFLLPKLMDEIVPAPRISPVVILNVHESRCDALIVYSATSIFLAPLSKLTKSAANSMRSQMMERLRPGSLRGEDDALRASYTANEASTLPRILRRLWTLVVHPVLAELKQKDPDAFAKKRLPHVTWCPTGLLASLPLHAAGDYAKASKGQQGPKAFERIVSSYTTTLSALLPSRQSGSPATQGALTRKQMLIVSISSGARPLHGAKVEAENIQSRYPPDNLLHLSNEDATVEAVREAISTHQPRLLHLACHGMQNRVRALDSAFSLHDGPLTVGSLMTLNQKTSGAEVAFLSACQTATGDENLPDEAVHLAASMLTVGYRSVVGTMWSVSDKWAPQVADDFYTQLEMTTEEGKHADVAYALHEAVRHLREHLEVGEEQFHLWVPFVHFGQ